MKQFRVLITGSRTWDDYDMICKKIVQTIADYIQEYPELQSRPVDWVTIVHGNNSKGADKLADIFATQVLGCPVERYDADWRLGKKAGYLRNRRMVNSAPDVCLAFIRDKSPGATGCYNLAKAAGIPSEKIRYEDIHGTV